ncbi:hypothetical protein MANES_09G156000v8 [Manihot esculenta]|uniref:Uncharacterized protein n=1 Tax=Manihot esculenta TaxID=3983 RepID=A0A2C9VB58_MANES|nr:hypothetical protein MANES_09G156000v8 [Manihot esculenta]
MAGISPNPTLTLKRIHGIRCCSGTPGNEKWSRVETKAKTPGVLKFAVSGVTELLRLFSFSSKDSLDRVSCEERDEISVSGIDDVVMILMADYENAYFVTGIFTSAIYAEDCLFEDPTIRFRGTELYARNLKLLVPFFDSPSIRLQDIEKGVNSETKFVQAKWKLRTYLKFPWRPLISIDGNTIYEINDEFKVVRHAESWNVSALEAIGQIFTPSYEKPGD